MSGWKVKRIDGDNRRYNELSESLRNDTAFTDRGASRSWNEVMEQARLARNRGRRIGLIGEDSVFPSPAALDSVDHGNNARGTLIDYHVIVTHTDPDTGGVTRLPVVVSSNQQMTAEALGGLASAAAKLDTNWHHYSRGIPVDPSTSVLTSVIVTGVVSRG